MEGANVVPRRGGRRLESDLQPVNGRRIGIRLGSVPREYQGISLTRAVQG
jgi:hypothetical protein